MTANDWARGGILVDWSHSSPGIQFAEVTSPVGGYCDNVVTTYGYQPSAANNFNTATYMMSTGYLTSQYCGRMWGEKYAVFFDSITHLDTAPVALAWLNQGGARITAFEDYTLNSNYGTALPGLGTDRFGLDNSGSYNAGYALHLYYGLDANGDQDWRQWTQTPTWIGYQTWYMPGLPYPANPLRPSSSHNWNAFIVR